MKCAMCGKEMGETEHGKQYCYECEKRWSEEDDEIDLSFYADGYVLFMEEN